MADQVSQQEQDAGRDVKERVQAFARAILETEEYRAFMRANEALQQDETARDLLNLFQLKTAEVQRTGFDATGLDALKALQGKVKENETLAAFFATQAALVALLKQTNDRISAKIGRQFAQARQGGCC